MEADPAAAAVENAVRATNQERALKRATLVAAVLRKFVAKWTAARQTELDAERAAAAAGKPKPQKKKRKLAEDKEAGGKKKKSKPKTPVGEAWAWLMGSLDELVNKSKRVGLEDLYRGADQLAAGELGALRNIMATANKKVLPTDGMNLNQLSLRAALSASAAACEYGRVDRATAAPTPALAVMRDRGLGARELMDVGFSESELLRIGFALPEVCELARHEPARLRAAGVGVGELVAGLGGPAGLPPDLRGFRGVQRLRAAGYSAAEMVAGGVDNAWDLRRAGFTATEVFSAGVPAAQLRPAGYGLPELQPPAFLAPSLAPLQTSDPRLLPPLVEGTRGGIWPRLLQPPQSASAPKDALNSTGRSATSAGAASRFGGTLRPRPGTAASAASASVPASSPTAAAAAAAAGTDFAPQRTVAWPDTSVAAGGGAAGSLATSAAFALPPPPAMSRAPSYGSVAA